MLTKLLWVFLFIVSSAGTIKASEWPRPNVNDCSFYYQLEEKLHCQSKGVDYLTHYAPYYCQTFKKKSGEWSVPLKKWAQKTEECLQEMLYEQRSNQELSCENLQKIAFKTHSACYNKADLCELSMEETLEVLKVIKLKDFFTEFRYSNIEILSLIKACAVKWWM